MWAWTYWLNSANCTKPHTGNCSPLCLEQSELGTVWVSKPITFWTILLTVGGQSYSKQHPWPLLNEMPVASPSSCDNKNISPDIVTCLLGAEASLAEKHLVVHILTYFLKRFGRVKWDFFFKIRRLISLSMFTYWMSTMYLFPMYCLIHPILWGRQCSFHFTDKDTEHRESLSNLP